MTTRREGPVDPHDQHVVQRLDLMMREEKAFLSPHLSIERRAARLDVPVHRLCAIINTALGRRNFTVFVNCYRIDFVKAALGTAHPVPRLFG